MSEINNENIEVSETEETEAEMIEENNSSSTSSDFQLGLFLKIGVFLLFLYGLSRYLWDNFIRAWWNGTASDGLKRIVFWIIFLSITSFVYKLVKDDKSN